MKKKSVVILLAGAFSISMIGCGGGRNGTFGFGI